MTRGPCIDQAGDLRRRASRHFLALIKVRALRTCLRGMLPLLLTLPSAHAQVDAARIADANLDHPTRVVTVQRDGYSIAGLVTHLEGATTFKHGVALFPGYPSIMRLRDDSGEPRFDLRGNFLLRSRRHWLDAQTLVVAVDAPSDQWGSFTQLFREVPRYGADVAALLDAIGREHGVENWTFVGTSEGAVSAFHAARMNPRLARRTILSASLFQATRNGPGLASVAWGELAAELLWVHHADDPCTYTSYRDARAYAQRTRKPLLTVHGGGPWRGAACEAFTAHGFVGVERETVDAMRAWVKSGVVPADVRP